MANRWPTKVKEAICEAVARGDRHSEALVRLHAGTLPGLDGEPVSMPARTFTYQWTRAKREQLQAGTYSGPTVLQTLVVEINREEAGSDDPEVLAEASGYPVDVVREVLPLIAEAEKRSKDKEGGRHWKAWEVLTERQRAAGSTAR